MARSVIVSSIYSRVLQNAPKCSKMAEKKDGCSCLKLLMREFVSFCPDSSLLFFSSTSLSVLSFDSSHSRNPHRFPLVVAKPKKQVVVIFGTFGGIGFTEQNELFVGRIAMLGFAFIRISCNDDEERASRRFTKAARNLLPVMDAPLVCDLRSLL